MRYFFGFLVAVGLIILLIIMIFHGGNKNKVPTTSRSLISYANTGSQVSMDISGTINADSEHRQIRVTVDRNNVTFEVMRGFQGEVITSKTYENNLTAYNAFLHALNRVGFTRGNNDKALRDETGVCPLGNRYVFKLTQNGEDLERFWTTSCGSPKTYLGNFNATLTLFRLQVPDYNRLAPNL